MTAAERVACGATRLDEKRPGWAAEIDLSALDLANSCRCVLGQIYGSASYENDSGFLLGLRALGLTGIFNEGEYDEVEFGFDVTRDEYSSGRGEAYVELDELWIAEIQRRTGGTR